MQVHTLTIEQFLKQGLYRGYHYRNQLIGTDRLTEIERFKSPFRIDAMLLLVCTNGTLDCRVNLQSYHLCSDQIFITFPEDILQICQAEEVEAYAMLLSTDFLNDLQIDFRQRSDFYLQIRQQAVCQLPHEEMLALKPYYTLLQSNIQTLHDETESIVRGLVQAFSYTIISMVRRHQRREESGTDKLNRNKQLFQKFMALVKRHHTQMRGVQFYADKLCLTPNYLSGVIKEYTGKTALEWVNEYVILEAKLLLNDPDLSIQEIAYQLNFPTQSAFGKYFKQQVGMGPRLYRNRDH